MPDVPNQNIVQVIEEYGKKLFGFIRQKVNTDEDAEDILQEVWFRFSEMSATRTIDQISGWLFTVARNKIIDQYRKRKPELLDDYIYENDEGNQNVNEILLSDYENPETEHLKNIFWEAFFTALDELPDKQRRVFVQNELEEKTLQQIANETGENLKTIISRKRYAVNHLRKTLQYFYDDLMDY